MKNKVLTLILTVITAMISISTAQAQDAADGTQVTQAQDTADETQVTQAQDAADELHPEAQDTTTVQTATAEMGEWSVTSPDGRLAVTVNVGETITWGLSLNGRTLIAPSQISMTLTGGTVYGAGGEYTVETTHATSGEPTQTTQEQDAPDKTSETTQGGPDNNELTLKFNDFDLIFKVFNTGAAYRFVARTQPPFEVLSEQADFTFPEDWTLYTAYVNQHNTPIPHQFFHSFENRYEIFPISQWTEGRIAFMPLLVDAGEGVKLCITETDLTDYPGMNLYNGNGSRTLTAVHAPYPREWSPDEYKNIQLVVRSREDYIAKYDDTPTFPWRIVAVSTEDKDLLINDLTYRLARPQATDSDFSWVRPGKVAWDWWNDWNLYGVDFKAGINNDTYKYYMDFASAHGIEYIILDEGWSVANQADLMQVVPEIDIKELVDYGAERNVGIILWSGFWPFMKDMENVCRHYSEMGVKGFKVDFMDRDDQTVTRFEREAAAMAAKYHLVLDFHGTFKPVGLHREFPNVLNYEGVHGLEQMKWSGADVDEVTYDVTIPFIRQVAGPLDYTQGAMRNSTRESYRPVNSEPMSQGTRCRQLAEYVVFNSPLAMLCDSPSAYMAEPECLDYIAKVPTVWDEIVPLAGEVGKYVAVAKRSGDKWYVGAMTDWDARDMELDLSFLGEGEWTAETYADGVNADRIARDYVKAETALESTTRIRIHLAPGGGFAAVFRK